MRKRMGAFVVICAGVVAACQVIAGIERVGKVVEGAEGAPASSTSSTGGPNPNDPCKHVLAPAKAAQNDPGGDGDNTFYLAVKTLSLTDPAANGIDGLDLDGTCTCDNQKGTAFDGGPSCTAPQNGPVTCDLDGGVDNAGLALFKSVFQEVALATQQNYQDDLNNDIASGKRTIMLYVANWNGLPNDVDVQVSLFISNGTFPPNDGSGNPNTAPKWDGNDTWSYPSSLHKEGVTVKPAVTEQGYVTNGRLVVQNQNTVTIIFGNAGLDFGDAVVLGDLAKDATSGVVSLTGIIGGRISQSNLLGAAGQIATGGGNYVCNDQGGLYYHAFVEPAICAAADISASSNADFTNGGCDAISATLAILAQSAKVDGDTPVDPITESNPCVPGGDAAPNYTCPSHH